MVTNLDAWFSRNQASRSRRRARDSSGMLGAALPARTALGLPCSNLRVGVAA